MRMFVVLSLSLFATAAFGGECTLERGGERISLPYQYAVQLSDPTDEESPVLSRLICASSPFEEEQLWSWSTFNGVFHAEGHQGFYLQFQDGGVIVVGLAGEEENYSSAGFPALVFDGEISPERVVGTLVTDPAPAAYDETIEWTVSAEVDLAPVAAY